MAVKKEVKKVVKKETVKKEVKLNSSQVKNDAIKKASMRMNELKQYDRMGLIRIIKELEKW